MGKFKHNLTNGQNNLSNLVDKINSDFDGLFQFDNQSPQEILNNITAKVSTANNVEFDQTCLILQRYLSNQEFLNLLLSASTSTIDTLVARFNQETNLNAKWMISELFKSLSSLCSLDQLSLLLTENFRNLVLQQTINIQVEVLNGLNQNEYAILRNLLDCISNLCETNSQLCQFIPIDWLQRCILSTRDNIELCSNFCHLFFTVSEKAPQIDLFGSNVDQLLIFSSHKLPQTNLSFVYIISALKNSIIFKNESNKNPMLLKIIQDYGYIFSDLLNIPLVDKCNKNKNDDDLDENNNSDNEDAKQMIKEIEYLSECKLLIIDLLQALLSEFLNEELEEDDEEVDVNDQHQDDEIDMEITNQNEQLQFYCKDDIKNLLLTNNFIDCLVNTITNDDDNVFRDTYEIEHLSSSIRLIKSEAYSLYLLMNQFVPERYDAKISDLQRMLIKFEEQTNELIDSNEDYFKNFSLLCNEMIKECLVHMDNTIKTQIVEVTIKLLNKFQLKYDVFTVNLTRMLLLIAIQERNQNTSFDMILNISVILLRLASASLLQVESNNLKLSAELLDCIIDLFSEDNLKEIEDKLQLIDKMKDFNAKFQSMCKKQAKKMKKSDASVIQIIKDNLKPFIDYKFKNSK